MTQNPVTIVPDDETLIRLADEAARTWEAFLEGFRAKYGEGEPVRWVYGSVQRGHVIRQGYNDRLYVHNSDTGADYWIHGHRVLDALRPWPEDDV